MTVLECSKAELVTRKQVLDKSANQNSQEARRRAYAAGRQSARKCVTAHGYKRKT